MPGTLRSVATIGGMQLCFPPAIHGQMDEIGSLWTCRECGRRYVREEFYSEDGRWLGAMFDLSPDSEPFEPFVPKIKTGRRMPLAHGTFSRLPSGNGLGLLGGLDVGLHGNRDRPYRRHGSARLDDER